MTLPSQKVRNGLKPLKPDRRDYDFLKTKKLAGVPQTLPSEYDVDAKLWIPDQNIGTENLFQKPVPPMPYGCTNYTQADLCSDEDKTLYDPSWLEEWTHANQNGGTDLRTSLNAVVKHGLRKQDGTIVDIHNAYYNIRPSKYIDAFDAARLAMLSVSIERRGVSVGTPWFATFFPKRDGIIEQPDSYNAAGVGWHNYAVKGWKTINGVPYLKIKPWCGITYGDNGFGYMSRELFNSLIAIPGTAMFTIDKDDADKQTVDMSIVQEIIGYLLWLWNRSLSGLFS